MAVDESPKQGRPRSDQVELATSRLVLRGAHESDAEHLNMAFSDPEVMRYWSEPPHKDLDRTKAWMATMTNSPGNGVTDFIICLKPGLTPIGKIGVWQDDEIGFLLGRDYWGKGLAKEALERIISHLFLEKDFKLLTADTDPRNAASIGLLKKVGFEEYAFKEKTFQIGEDWVDSLYLKLEREMLQKGNLSEPRK